MSAGDLANWAAVAITMLIGAMGYGVLRGQVKALEDRMTNNERTTAELTATASKTAATLARFDERLKGIQEGVARVERALEEKSFQPSSRSRDRPSS